MDRLGLCYSHDQPSREELRSAMSWGEYGEAGACQDLVFQIWIIFVKPVSLVFLDEALVILLSAD